MTADVMEFIRPDEGEQTELFPGWATKPSFFSLLGGSRRPFGGELSEHQAIRGTFDGVVTAVHVGKERVVYDIQLLDAEIE